VTAAELIEQARGWIGVPFRHQGRNRLGVDCAGLLVALLQSCGRLPADFRAPERYARRPNGELLAVVERYCERTQQDPARVPGAIVLIRWPGDTQPSHVALSTGSTLIHAYMRARRVIEAGYRGPWVRDTHSAWLIPGIEYV
jgi:cell wall-associated NlpC family hydrolase